jgi:hypothetical protein
MPYSFKRKKKKHVMTSRLIVPHQLGPKFWMNTDYLEPVAPDMALHLLL